MPFWPDPIIAGWAAVALTAPLLIWAAISDLKYMIIPNSVSIGMVVVFVVFSALFLTPEEALWRAAAGIVTLIVGIGLVIAAKMGGGDMKLLASIAPFIAPERVGTAMVMLSLCLLILLLPLVMTRRMLRRRATETTWVAFQPGIREVPMGVSIAVATMLYLMQIALTG
ncbi:MAG: prepilin peptidase CpaA [Paracoccaceae bacterium]|jgi:prepilin peptidase CpaA